MDVKSLQVLRSPLVFVRLPLCHLSWLPSTWPTDGLLRIQLVDAYWLGTELCIADEVVGGWKKLYYMEGVFLRG